MFLVGSSTITSIAQNTNWKLNPKVIGDTIDVHIYEKHPQIFASKTKDVLTDDKGYIWISTRYEGLIRLDVNNPVSFKQNKPEGYNFDQLSINKMYQHDNKLYFSSDRGFLTYNHEQEEFHRYGKSDLAKLSPYRTGAQCLAFLSQDSVLIGNKHGLTLFDLKSDKIIKHLWDDDPPKDGASTYNHVHQLKVDPKDKTIVWGVGRRGLFKLDCRSWNRTYYPFKDDLNNSLKFNYMIDFETVGDNIYIVYIGKQKNQLLKGNQIVKFNKKNGEWKVILDILFKDKYKYIYPAEIQTLQRYGKYLFVASRDFGAQIIDTDTDSTFQTYLRNPHFRLPNNWEDPNRLLSNYGIGFYSATIDSNGYLWAIHNREDVVRSKEPMFTNESNTSTQYINLNNLYINGIKHRKQSFRDTTQKGRFLLNERERDLAFKFAIINPIYDNIKYEYRYNSKEWKSPIETGLVQISKLKGGNNIIDVRASIEGKTICHRSYNFYSTPRIHEKWWFFTSLLLLIFFIIYQFYKQKIRSIRKEEQIKTSFNQQIAEMEMEVLKAQMNPHFIFNSLNSIKHYSLNKSKRETSQYINTFSRLLRQILQNSNAKVVSLAQELKALELYVEIEKKRLENKLEFKVILDDDINEDTIFIPPMILQPFIENAIWHGLMMKAGKGTITLTVEVLEKSVICEIEDNGIGRKAASKVSDIKSNYAKESLGTSITHNRLKIAEKIYGSKTDLRIVDLYDKAGNAAGTKVIVNLPRIYKSKKVAR